jgi:hypothetical protein
MPCPSSLSSRSYIRLRCRLTVPPTTQNVAVCTQSARNISDSCTAAHSGLHCCVLKSHFHASSPDCANRVQLDLFGGPPILSSSSYRDLRRQKPKAG